MHFFFFVLPLKYSVLQTVEGLHDTLLAGTLSFRQLTQKATRVAQQLSGLQEHQLTVAVSQFGKRQILVKEQKSAAIHCFAGDSLHPIYSVYNSKCAKKNV